MIGQLVTRHPTSPESARAVSRAVSFASLAFIPNRQADHDPYCFVAKLTHSFQRAPVTPRPLCVYCSPDYALSPRNFQNSPRITPPYYSTATIHPLRMRAVLLGDPLIVGAKEWGRGVLGQLSKFLGHFLVSLGPLPRVLHPAERLVHHALSMLQRGKAPTGIIGWGPDACIGKDTPPTHRIGGHMGRPYRASTNGRRSDGKTRQMVLAGRHADVVFGPRSVSPAAMARKMRGVVLVILFPQNAGSPRRKVSWCS
jgi:hypothetical protein